MSMEAVSCPVASMRNFSSKCDSGSIGNGAIASGTATMTKMYRGTRSIHLSMRVHRSVISVDAGEGCARLRVWIRVKSAETHVENARTDLRVLSIGTRYAHPPAGNGAEDDGKNRHLTGGCREQTDQRIYRVSMRHSRTRPVSYGQPFPGDHINIRGNQTCPDAPPKQCHRRDR